MLAVRLSYSMLLKNWESLVKGIECCVFPIMCPRLDLMSKKKYLIDFICDDLKKIENCEILIGHPHYLHLTSLV